MIVIYWKGEVWNSLKKLLDFLEVENVLTDDKEDNKGILEKGDTIIPSPWIKPSHIVYQDYYHKVKSELDFVYDLLEEKELLGKFGFVGVTGTDWKSTVSYVTSNLLKTTWSPVYIWWNFSPSFAEVLYQIFSENKEIPDYNLIVLEISSFMLYATQRFKFDYTIWTNFSSDHLDWHRDIVDYYNSKKKIVPLTQNYCFVGNKNIFDVLRKNGFSNVVLTNTRDFESGFVGDNNKLNLSLAYDLALEFVDQEQLLQEKIRSLKPLSHRMEYIGEYQKVRIYDDGKSTSSNSLRNWLVSVTWKTVLICWGSDKKDNFRHLKSYLEEKAVFLCIIGETSHKFEEIANNLWIDYRIFDNLEDAVNCSLDAALEKEAENILFSPGCASFDMFRNWQERADFFRNCLKF